jgi:hypothetical protein
MISWLEGKVDVLEHLGKDIEKRSRNKTFTPTGTPLKEQTYESCA